MQKNVAGQKIGSQMVSATDGSAFTGSVTVYVTGDAGTQAAGSVGSAACAHEGNGYHTYAPAQAETNYDLVAFTFIGTGAVPSTVQVFTGFPQTGDNYARLGAPAGASVSADVAAVKAQTAAIETDTQDLQTQVGTDGAGLTALPWNAAWDAEVQSEAQDAITASALATAANLATLAGYVDTEVASILAAVDTEVAAIKAKTDNLPTDPADQSAVEAAITAATGGLATSAALATVAGYVDTEVAAVLAAVDTEVAAIKAKTDNLPAAPASTTNITAGIITTVTNLTNAPTNGDLTATMKTSVTTAATAATPTAAAVTGAVGSVTAPVTAGTVSDKTGYALSSAGVQAIWDALTSALTTAGSVGKRIADYLDAAISSRGTSTYAGGDTSGTTTLLGRIIGTLATGTHNPQTGDAYARLGAPAGASVSADIAATKTAVDGYGSMTYGAVTTMSTYVDTEVAAILAAVDTEVAAIKAKTDNLPASPAAVGSAMTLTAAYDAAKTAASQTSVDDLPTNAELASALAGADDAVLAAIAALNNLSSAGAQSAAAAALTAYGAAVQTSVDDLEGRLTAIRAGYLDNLSGGAVATAAALATVDDFIDTEVAAIKVVTDKLDTTLELDGVVYRYTINALEQAPAGGGGGGATAIDIRIEMDANSTKLAAIREDTGTSLPASIAGLNNLSNADAQAAATASLNAYDPPTKAELDAVVAGLATASALSAVGGVVEEILADTGTTLPSTLATINGNVLSRTSLGAGAIAFTYTLTTISDGSPIADADVWVTTDAAGSNLIAAGRTNANGQIVFYLDAGTVYIWRQKSGWMFANPDTEVVA